MSSPSSGRPSILANLILMLLVGGMLVGFFALLRSCEEKAGNAMVGPLPQEKKAPGSTEPKKVAEPTKEEIAKTVAEANQVRKTQPVPKGPDDDQSGRPFYTPPVTETKSPVVVAEAPPTMPTIPPTTATPPPAADAVPTSTVTSTNPASTPDLVDALPPKEPVREVATGSAEGNALIKDASARVDEAPTELYSDKAKAKVREGLQTARRIFKVHTVYFEKGGARPGSGDAAELAKALGEGALAEVMDDPRAVFFVLGFADRTGDAGTNKKLSKDRAEAVINLLKSAGALNLTYPVAIGSTELVSAENQHKNRAAEVWLVLP
jgi:outer membrane protein OmpA-like peptidoglycan-associated protein